MQFLDRITRVAIVLGVLSSAVVPPLKADENAGVSAGSDAVSWTGFLTGTYASHVNPEDLPLKWSPETIAWQAKLKGEGQSSPTVCGQSVFVTSVEGPNKETYHVSQFSLNDGSAGWTHSLTSTAPVESTYLVSRAAPTPLCDESHVFAFFESGDVVALTHDGNEVWKRSLSVDYGKFDNKFGLGASPVQDKDAVYILIDHAGPSYLVALSKKDGTTLWKTDRESRRSWSSPFMARVDGQSQIVCSSVGSVDGYDPATGSQLWTYTDVGSNSAATPVVFGENSVLLGSLIRPSEGPSEKAERSNLLGRILRKDAGWEFRVDWIAEKARGSFSTPVCDSERAYWINSAGVIFCLDAATGKELYSKRLPCGQCWATPIVVGSRIYIFGKDGATTVLQAGSEYKELSEANRLWVAAEPAEKKDAAPPEKKEAESATAEKKEPSPSEKKEPDPSRRRAMANGSGPIQYAAVVVPGTILVRSGDTLHAVKK